MPAHETATTRGRLRRCLTGAAVATAAAGVVVIAAAPAGAEPTCSNELGIAVHGQHIVGDYVTGLGHENLAWAPRGSVGGAVAGDGVVVAGGPGPGFHFPNGFAPGASFCVDQSSSPGLHL